MVSEYSIRTYLPGDEEQIIPLLVQAFDDWRLRGERASGFWDWLYIDNPIASNVITLGVIDDKIIATHLTLTLRIKICDKIFNCIYCTDHTVHPDYRRMGVSNKIVNIVIDRMPPNNISFDYFYSDNPILLKKFPTKYDSLPYPACQYVRIRNIKLHCKMKHTKRAWLTSMGFKTLKLAAKLKNLIRTKHQGGDFRVSKIRHFDDRVDIFWEKIKNNHNFILERSKEYLNWRYCDQRAGEYRVMQAEDEVQVLGYIVLAIIERHKGYREGYIIDILTIPERLDIADALIKEAVDYCDNNEINAINCLVIKNHRYESILNKNEFINRRKNMIVFYFQYGIENESRKLHSSSPSSIHLCYGDLFSM